jgi:tripartite-type tricarboxylate transporter receptor subunit TctC
MAKGGLAAALALAVATVAVTAFAQAGAYPERPIRIIVPFPAGDGIDLQARVIGQQLTERWNQRVIVDNRPGAGTLIATEIATRASPDGYNVLLVTTTFTINPSLHPKVPYHPEKDFAPLVQTTAIPLIVVAGPGFAPGSLPDVMALAKQKPGQLTMGNSGIGTAAHISMELLDSMAGIRFLHVPYKGIPPAVIDLVSGQLQMLVTSPAQVIGQIREGKLKPIVVTGARRMTQLPNVGTVREAGVADYEAYAWIGMVVPAGTPKDIVGKLNREIVAVLNTPDIRTRLTNDGSEVVAGTPDAFGAHIRSELAKWAKVIRSAGIKPQ